MSDTAISKDLQKRIFDLTFALYRVTDFFPANETLRKHLREKADEIWSAILEYKYSANPQANICLTMAKITAIKGYLAIARGMGFSSPVNMTVLEKHYDFWESFFKNELSAAASSTLPDYKGQGKEIPASDIVSDKMSDRIGHMSDRIKPVSDNLKPMSDRINDRQQKIVDYLRKADYASLGDFSRVFRGNVGLKTLHRELLDLAGKNIIVRQGDKRWAVYKLFAR